MHLKAQLFKLPIPDHLLGDVEASLQPKKQKRKSRRVQSQKALLKVSQEDVKKLANIIEHSITNKYYQSSNLRMLNRNHEYQCSIYKNQSAQQSKQLTDKQKEYQQRFGSGSSTNQSKAGSFVNNFKEAINTSLSQSNIIIPNINLLQLHKMETVQEITEQKKGKNLIPSLDELAQNAQDIADLQKQIQKKENEQQEQLSKDVFQAMITAEQHPKWALARRTKDFICKERIKKNKAKDFLNSKVDFFFQDKLKQAQENETAKKYNRLLNKIASQGLSEEKQYHRNSQSQLKQANSQNEVQSKVLENSNQNRPGTAFTKFGVISDSLTSNRINSGVSRYKNRVMASNNSSSQKLIHINFSDQNDIKSQHQHMPRLPMNYTRFKTSSNFDSHQKSTMQNPYNDEEETPISNLKSQIKVSTFAKPRNTQDDQQSLNFLESEPYSVKNMNSVNRNYLQFAQNINNNEQLNNNNLLRPQSQSILFNSGQKSQNLNQYISNTVMSSQNFNSNRNQSSQNPRPKTSSQRVQARQRLLKSASAVDILKRNLMSAKPQKPAEYISQKQLQKAQERKEKVQMDVISVINSCQKFQKQAKSKSLNRQINRNFSQYQRKETQMKNDIEYLKDEIMMARLEKFNYLVDEEAADNPDNQF
eukprot:403340826